MFRIDDATAAVSKPAAGTPGTEGYFTEGNPGGGIPATRVTARWLNSIQDEIRAVVTAAGLTPANNNDAQLLAALNALYAAGGGRTRLGANTDYYVATTGNDSNNGSIGSKWLTLQHAYDYIANNVDLNGYTATINVADGTYTAGLNAQTPAVGGTIAIKGNVTTPANCILSTSGSACIAAYNGVQLNVLGGFKLTGSSYLLMARGSGAVITVTGAMEYGTGGGALLGQINAFWGGFVEILSNYTISGSAGEHYYASAGTIRVVSVTVTVSGTPAFAGEFALCSDGGAMELYPNTYSGSATGVRYTAQLNGVINTNGGGSTYLPGNSAGGTANGGVYV